MVPVVSHSDHRPRPQTAAAATTAGSQSLGFIDPSALSHFETSYYDDNFVPEDATAPDTAEVGDNDRDMDVATYAMSTLGGTYGDDAGIDGDGAAGGVTHARPMGQLPPLSGAVHARLSPLRSPTDARYWVVGSPDARPKSGRQVLSVCTPSPHAYISRPLLPSAL